jgi:hypothetical protein
MPRASRHEPCLAAELVQRATACHHSSCEIAADSVLQAAPFETARKMRQQKRTCKVRGSPAMRTAGYWHAPDANRRLRPPRQRDGVPTELATILSVKECSGMPNLCRFVVAVWHAGGDQRFVSSMLAASYRCCTLRVARRRTFEKVGASAALNDRVFCLTVYGLWIQVVRCKLSCQLHVVCCLLHVISCIIVMSVGCWRI